MINSILKIQIFPTQEMFIALKIQILYLKQLFSYTFQLSLQSFDHTDSLAAKTL